MDAIANAVADLKRHPDKMILLGMTPNQGQETEYGYIQFKKHPRATLTRPITGFVEKPPLALARRLINDGVLWNTMVFTVRSSTLWQMVRDTVPSLYNAFGLIQSMLGSIHAPGFIQHIYQTIPNVNSPLTSAHLWPRGSAFSRYRMSAGATWGDCFQYSALADRNGSARNIPNASWGESSTPFLVCRFIG